MNAQHSVSTGRPGCCTLRATLTPVTRPAVTGTKRPLQRTTRYGSGGTEPRATIENDVIGPKREPPEGAAHRQHRRMKDVHAVDLAHRRRANPDGQRARSNLLGQARARLRGQDLRVVDATNDALVRRHDDGA